MITAHSGCDFTQDNSMNYLKYAFSLPVDALEVDVRKDISGELILSHDETEEKSVKLKTVFSLLHEHPEKKLNCDMKEENLEADVMALAQIYEVDQQLIFTGSVNKELFRKGNTVYPQVLWFANLDLFVTEQDTWMQNYEELDNSVLREHLLEILGEMKLYNTAGINWRYQLAEIIWKEAKEMGMGISVWTVDDHNNQKVWLKRKIDNITSRNISGLIALK